MLSLPDQTDLNRAQIRVRKCVIPAVFTQILRISYHKCRIFPHHFLASMGTTSVWCDRVLVYLDTKSTVHRVIIRLYLRPYHPIKARKHSGGSDWIMTSHFQKMYVWPQRSGCLFMLYMWRLYTVTFRRHWFDCGPTLQMQDHHCAAISHLIEMTRDILALVNQPWSHAEGQAI